MYTVFYITRDPSIRQNVWKSILQYHTNRVFLQINWSLNATKYYNRYGILKKMEEPI